MVRIYVSMFFPSLISSCLPFISYFSMLRPRDFFMSRVFQRIEKQTRPTAEADLSLPVMLWCIIPKWMVNGLRNLYGVKAFFLEIVAGIRSIASILPAFVVYSDCDAQSEKYNEDN